MARDAARGTAAGRTLPRVARRCIVRRCNLKRKWQPLWARFVGKLEPKAEQVTKSVLLQQQKVRWITETVTGSLEYSVGEVPLIPIGSLRQVVDAWFLRIAKRVLGLSKQACNRTLITPAGMGGCRSGAAFGPVHVAGPHQR